MPPPLPHASTPRGARACPPVCLRGGGHIIIQRGTGRAHTAHAQAEHTGHTAAARERQRYSNEYTISVSLPLVLFFHSLASFYDTICALLELPKLGYQYYCFFGFYQCDVPLFGRRALARTPRPQLDVIQ